MKESKLPDDQKKAALAQVRTDHTRQAHDELLAMHLASVEDAELSQEQRDQLAIHQSAGISQTMALQMIATAEEQANTDAQDVVQDSTPAINTEDADVKQLGLATGIHRELAEHGWDEDQIDRWELEQELIAQLSSRSVSMASQSVGDLPWILIDGGTSNHMFGTDVISLLSNVREVTPYPVKTAGGVV